MELQIEDWMIVEAQSYAVASARHTSNRRDFHKGGLAEKAKKCLRVN